MKSLIYFFIFLSFIFITNLPTYAEENKLVENLPKLKRNTEAISLSIGTVYSFSPMLGVNYLRLDFDLNENLTIGTSYGMGDGNYSQSSMVSTSIVGNIKTVSVHGKYYFFGPHVNNFFTETTVTGCFNFETPFNGNIIKDFWTSRPVSDFDNSYGAISQILGYEISYTYFKIVAKGGLAGIGSNSSSGSHPFSVKIGTIFDLSLGFIF